MRDEVAGGLVLFLFGGATVALSLGMPLGTLRMAGPGMFPLALGVLLMCLSAAWSIAHLSRKAFPAKGFVWSQALKRVMPFVGAMGGATLLLNLLGYPLTSFAMLTVLFRLMGSRSWACNALLALGVAGVSYLVFVQWLQVPLPRGFLGL